MTILVYDLECMDGRRPSPFCWRTKYALAHKGLAFEARPVGFGDIQSLYGGAYKTVPIIEDDGRHVGDSWAIADYLDSTYPDTPKLFGTPTERALCRYIEMTLFTTIAPHLLSSYVKDIHDHALEKDRAYFRESREKRLGRTLEEVCAGRESRVEQAREGLQSIRLTLAQGQPFISGEHPGYADYMVAGFLLWVASVATLPLLRADDSLLPWFERVRDLYGGLGRTTTLNALAA
jgi:glutathione S-transferase